MFVLDYRTSEYTMNLSSSISSTGSTSQEADRELLHSLCSSALSRLLSPEIQTTEFNNNASNPILTSLLSAFTTVMTRKADKETQTVSDELDFAAFDEEKSLKTPALIEHYQRESASGCEGERYAICGQETISRL